MRKFQATDASINRVIGAVRRESTTKIVGGEVISVTPEAGCDLCHRNIANLLGRFCARH